jgi:hypothetical protein
MTVRGRRENGTKVLCYCKAESDAKSIETYGELLCEALRSEGVHRGALGAREYFEVVVKGKGSRAHAERT